MYELEYVRRRKRRKLAAIIGFASVGAISGMSIVAFLGRSVGTFTVSLETGNVKLSLCEKSDFINSSSYLRASGLTSFQEYTYGNFANIGDDVIDSETTDYTLGANFNKNGDVSSLNFYKYTFFVKNVGDVPCRYHFSLDILDQSSTSDGRTIDETLRVTLYENGNTDVHNKVTYGKRSVMPHEDENGEPDYRSPISVSESEATSSNPFQGYAEMFESATVITEFMNNEFKVDEIKRYTIVIWLEGFRSSNLVEAPKGAKLNIGVNIDAYEI